MFRAQQSAFDDAVGKSFQLPYPADLMDLWELALSWIELQGG